MEKKYFSAITFLLSSTLSVLAGGNDQNKQHKKIQKVISHELSEEFPVFARSVSGREALVKVLPATLFLAFECFLVYAFHEALVEDGRNAQEAFQVSDWEGGWGCKKSRKVLGCLSVMAPPFLMAIALGHPVGKYFVELIKKGRAPRMSMVDLVKKLKKPGKIPTHSEMFTLDLWYRSFERALTGKELIELDEDGQIDQKASRDFITVVGEESVKKMDTIFKLRAQQKKKPSPALYTAMVETILSLASDLVGMNGRVKKQDKKVGNE